MTRADQKRGKRAIAALDKIAFALDDLSIGDLRSDRECLRRILKIVNKARR